MALSLEIKDFILGLEQKKSAQRLIMKDELFEELVNSIREGGQILRGEFKPAREEEVSVQTFLDILAQAPDVEPENPLDRIPKHKNKK